MLGAGAFRENESQIQAKKKTFVSSEKYANLDYRPDDLVGRAICHRILLHQQMD